LLGCVFDYVADVAEIVERLDDSESSGPDFVRRVYRVVARKREKASRATQIGATRGLPEV
jgi:hypothetical protein